MNEDYVSVPMGKIIQDKQIKKFCDCIPSPVNL